MDGQDAEDYRPGFPGEQEPAGATPLDPDEAESLIPDLHTRQELNDWELTNILKAEQWALDRRRRSVLTKLFVAELHRRMFDETWTWAGEFRRSDKSIGGYWATIVPALQDLLDDTKDWISKSTYPSDEILARFHHRLVSIHPFPNGNGRHARLMTDVLALSMRLKPPTWGQGDPISAGRSRDFYLTALQQADEGNVAPLITFMGS